MKEVKKKLILLRHVHEAFSRIGTITVVMDTI